MKAIKAGKRVERKGVFFFAKAAVDKCKTNLKGKQPFHGEHWSRRRRAKLSTGPKNPR